MISWLKRLFGRNRKFLKRKYEGAAKGRRTSSWKTNNAAPDTEISGSLVILRARSRDLVRNNPFAARGIDILVQNVVGPGIVGTIKSPRSQAQDRLQKMWTEFTESQAFDYDGRHTLFGLQRLVMRSVAEAGEVLIRVRRRRSDQGFPIQFQVLEADHLELTDTRILENKNRLIHSIEFDEQGKRVAYHILKNHPGNSGILTAREKITIPANEMAHVFRGDRPGQNRGVPLLSPIMLRLRDLDDFEDATIVRQKVAACFTAFIRDIEAGGTGDLTETEREELGEKIEPGAMEFLPPGKDIVLSNPPGVNNYKEFMSVSLHAIAAGLNLSYEALTGNLSEVNFSSARMGWLQMQRATDTWRAMVLGPLFNRFVFQHFLKNAFLMGEDVREAKAIWTPPKREMIDPTKEIPAKIKEIRGGLTSLSEAIRERGRDAQEVLQEIADDAKKLDELGLTLDSDPRKVNLTGVHQDAEKT